MKTVKTRKNMQAVNPDEFEELPDYSDVEDNRPAPNPRRLAHLWQAYLLWDEFMEIRKAHSLRLSSAERGKSNFDIIFERDVMKGRVAKIKNASGEIIEIDFSGIYLDAMVDQTKKIMVSFGPDAGYVWTWATGIKGLGAGGMVAQLLAQIDDIGKFENVSKLWRFAGQAVIDGQKERNKKGEKSHYNRRLAAICWNISEQFVKQQTPVYAEIYYEEKAYLRRIHPEPVDTGRKNSKGGPLINYTNMHLHNMAKRKAVKIFLSHLWAVWREAQGLPVTEPYAMQILNHTGKIEPSLV